MRTPRRGECLAADLTTRLEALVRINLDQPLVSFDGKPIPVGVDDPSPTLLKFVVVGALVTDLRGEEGSGKDKFSRWQLAQRMQQGGVVDVDPPEFSMITDRIGKLFGTAIVGPAWNAMAAEANAGPQLVK